MSKINKFVFFGKTLYKRKSLCYNLICENSAAQPADIRFFKNASPAARFDARTQKYFFEVKNNA